MDVLEIKTDSQMVLEVKSETDVAVLEVESTSQGAPGVNGTNGTDGTDGTDGDDGTTPTIAIGTVTTVAAGEDATVVNSGTPTAAVLDFEIPQGEAGSSAGAVPTGSVFWFAANAAPSGYLKCNGAAVSRATYSALFAITSTTFGVGDNSTTFNLPDLRGEFVRGWADDGSLDAARGFGTVQTAANLAHTHTVTKGVDADGSTSAFQYGTSFASSATVNTSSSGGADMRPHNIALLPCIKT